MRSAIELAEWVSTVMQKDKAGVNSCVIAVEQQLLAVMYYATRKGEHNEQTLLDLWCAMHSGVLSMKTFVAANDMSATGYP